MEKSDAEACRERNWGPGTLIDVDDYNMTNRYRITAIGEEAVLVRWCGRTRKGGEYVPRAREAAEEMLDGGAEGAAKVG